MSNPQRTLIVAGYLAAMIGMIVGLDIAFLRGHDLWLRLVVNVAIVAVFLTVFVKLIQPRL